MRRIKNRAKAVVARAHHHHHRTRHWVSLGIVVAAAGFLVYETLRGNSSVHHLAIAVLAETVSRGVGGKES